MLERNGLVRAVRLDTQLGRCEGGYYRATLAGEDDGDELTIAGRELRQSDESDTLQLFERGPRAVILKSVNEKNVFWACVEQKCQGTQTHSKV